MVDYQSNFSKRLLCLFLELVCRLHDFHSSFLMDRV
jgi:hypothetical protein